MKKQTIENLIKKSKENNLEIISSFDFMLNDEIKTDNKSKEIDLKCLLCNEKFSNKPVFINSTAKRKYGGCKECQQLQKNLENFEIYKKEINDYPNKVTVVGPLEENKVRYKDQVVLKCHECENIWNTRLNTTLYLIRKPTKENEIRKLCPNCYEKDRYDQMVRIATSEKDYYDDTVEKLENTDFHNIEMLTKKEDLPNNYNYMTEVDLICKKCNDKKRRTMYSIKNDIRKKSRMCDICAKEVSAQKLAEMNKSDPEYFNKLVNIAKRINPHLIIYEDKFKNSHSKIDIKCKECNKIFERQASFLKSRMNCPNCNPRESSFEKAFSLFLKDKNVKFRKEVTIGLKNVSLLRFDFLLEDLDLIIEIDGIQHFKKVERFDYENSRKRDILKDNYFLEGKTDYKLIRVPATDPEKFIKNMDLVGEIIDNGTIQGFEKDIEDFGLSFISENNTINLDNYYKLV